MTGGKCFLKKKTWQIESDPKTLDVVKVEKTGMRSGDAQTGYQRSSQKSQNEINKPD